MEFLATFENALQVCEHITLACPVYLPRMTINLQVIPIYMCAGADMSLIKLAGYLFRIFGCELSINIFG